MATAHQVQASLQESIASTLAQVAVGGTPVTVTTAIGWPPIKVLHEIVRQPGINAAIGIYDMKSTKNVTRWAPTVLSQTMNLAGVIATLGNITLPTVLTLSGAVIPGDAIGLTVCLGGANSAGAVAVLAGTETLTAAAVEVVAAIAADPIMGPAVNATAVGNTVILSAVDGYPHFVVAATGNVGVQVTEVGRRQRDMQVVIWTGTELARQAVTDPIETLIANLESSGDWMQLPDGTQGRMTFIDDYYIETGSPVDLYRRDFHVEVEYGVTTLDPLYTVLAFEMQLVGGISATGSDAS